MNAVFRRNREQVPVYARRTSGRRSDWVVAMRHGPAFAAKIRAKARGSDLHADRNRKGEKGNPHSMGMGTRKRMIYGCPFFAATLFSLLFAGSVRASDFRYLREAHGDDFKDFRNSIQPFWPREPDRQVLMLAR